MGSAVLASRNDTSWPAHMGKMTYSNHHLNATPNPNPNSRKKQKNFHSASGNAVAGRFHNNVDSPDVTQTTFDDAYSFNQTSTSRNNNSNYGCYLTFKLASCSKTELLKLRKRLSGELQQIRDLQNRIESGRFSSTGNPISSGKVNENSVDRRPITAFGSAPNWACNNGIDIGYIDAVNFGSLLKDCKQILGKLLKNKSASIFKVPVDAVAMGLRDYHSIVKHPMDLGTVKSNLTKNLYHSAVEFAFDVRLTFNNALLYNPKHDRIHAIALQMLGRFEEYFRPVQEKIDAFANQRSERDFQGFQRNEELQGNLWNARNQTPPRGTMLEPIAASPVQVQKKIERMEMPMQAHSSASTPSHQDHQPVQEQVYSTVREPHNFQVTDLKEVEKELMKQPKPKAKDEIKRKMSMEEKQKLGFGLQNLPQEKMPQLVQILRKKHGQLAQDGDEIELDIETLDTDTLWELDRFVTNWKFMSKSKRQALVVNNESDGAGVAAPATPIPEADMGALSDKNNDLVKKFKDDDEDVDIDDDMPATSFPPVEIEKDEGGVGTGGWGMDGQDDEHGERGNASSSSSSGSSNSDSSSSSDSDSGSSSGSDSEADIAQS